METPYRTPGELIEGLQARQPPARRHLQLLFGDAVERLMDELITRHRLDADRELLVLHALHLAETMLRFRPLSEFTGLSWSAFRASVLLQLARLALQPHGDR